MQAYDWSSFLLRIPIDAEAAVIFHCWTSQEGLESWFLRSAKFRKADGADRDPGAQIEPGDTYVWMWHGWPDEVVEKGAILQLADNRLQFSFGEAGNVTVTVKQEAGQNIVELLQDAIPVDDHSKIQWHLGCTKGWLFYLTNLKSILEGGIDLRNRSIELKNVVNS